MSPSTPHRGHAAFNRQLILKGLVVVVSTWFISGSGVHAQAVPSQLVVRSYNTIGVPLPVLHHAEAAVGELLREAGLDSRWRNCKTSIGPSAVSTDLCADVINESEVIVRVVRTPRAITDVEVLGYSHVDPYRRQGTLATVFADRVRVLAAALRIDEGTLLGRAITHEVGHLLLGTLDHSETGLMRGAWHWSGHRGSDWLFSSAEATRMRAGLEARPVSPVLAVARAQSSP